MPVLPTCVSDTGQTYTVGGTLSGLTSGTVILVDSTVVGKSQVSLSSNGNFSFGARLYHGEAYSVSIESAPVNQMCTVSSPSGTVESQNVTTVAVNCAPIVADTNVLTYHNDGNRTGWNKTETTLTTANVSSAAFGLLAPVQLDEQSDTQPLVVTDPSVVRALGAAVAVVYVATEANTIFAIDSLTGKVLNQANFGPAVPTPLGCTNTPLVGINGTPVIDPASQTLYFITYTQSGDSQIHQIHAVDLVTLQDKGTSPLQILPVVHLPSGQVVTFDSHVQRQRAALLLLSNTIYAGFASYCDFSGSESRGWVVSFSTNPMLLQNAFLTNSLDPGGFLLSSVWMSGYGIATDATDVYFATGNSAGGTFDPTKNLTESAIKVSPSLVLLDSFTPKNVDFLNGNNWCFIICEGSNDLDLAAGGLMVLPDQPGAVPHVAVIIGKDGRMWALNRDFMGGHPASGDLPSNVQIGKCWCGPSYFEMGVDSIGEVVTSAGNQLTTWRLAGPIQGGGNLSFPTFGQVVSDTIPDRTDQGAGFFTSVSSNGLDPSTSVIWAVERPTGPDNHVTLLAYGGNPARGTLPLLFQQRAGFWDADGNANIVPTVANGNVYVASDGVLEIFGLAAAAAAAGASPDLLKKQALDYHLAVVKKRPVERRAQYWGTLKSSDKSAMTLTLRDGHLLRVDISAAAKLERISDVAIGEAVHVVGRPNREGVFDAEAVLRAKTTPASWGEDRARPLP